MRKQVQVPGVTKWALPFSLGIVAEGRYVFVAGQGPLDLKTGKVVPGMFEEQAALTFENVKTILEAAGASTKDVVKVNVYLTDLANFQAMNAVYRRHFSEPYPARTTVQVGLLGIMIEVDAIACLPQRRR
ncbi:MAG: RidA family protein [Deinococcus sp.]|nr:RidA family protein [Deinococcus sp.]